MNLATLFTPRSSTAKWPVRATADQTWRLGSILTRGLGSGWTRGLAIASAGLAFCGLAFAAAPNDITSGQRLWLDALDTQNLGYASTTTVPTYVGNISGGITNWKSKINGLQAGQSISGTTAPAAIANNTGVGANFAVTGNALTIAGDIWGPVGTQVTTTDNFVIGSTAALWNNSFLFGSQAVAGANRISSHFTWSNGYIYYDPICCLTNRYVDFSNPGGSAQGLSVNTLYISNWYASTTTNTKSVVMNANNKLIDNLSDVGTYTVPTGSNYSLGYDEGLSHFGVISENIVYNRLLGVAERRILNNYFSAKWGMAITADDRYAGDTAANGLYRYHVGGIGQESDSVATGTSEGLTISNGSFLASGRYLLAGLAGLSAAGTMTAYDATSKTSLTAPKLLSGTATTNIPVDLAWRSNRVWYLDKTDASNATGSVNLAFDAAGKLGIASGDLIAGDKLVLLYRASNSGNFQIVGNSTSYTTGSTPTFSVAANLLADGYYAIGKMTSVVKPNLAKTSAVYSDPVNNTTNPKNIPGAYVDFTLTLLNQGDRAMLGGSTNPIVLSDVIPNNVMLRVGATPATTSPITVGCSNNGSPSTLTLSAADIIYYSDSQGTTPIAASALGPDANGFSSLVKAIALKPQGTLAGATAIDTPPYPACTFTFRVKVN